jgi:arylsulfatase A-like enzyme
MGKDQVRPRRITRRDFLRGASLATLSLLASRSWMIHSAVQPVERSLLRPNVILIVADDLGYGDLGCYGQQRVQTPNLDRMAAEGMRFTRCYAASTVCAPSRWCLMTGLHVGHARTAKNRALLYAEDYTVAELLRSAGYTTAGIGKWGLGDPVTTGLPNDKGFDHWFGYLEQAAAHNYYPEYLWRNRETCWIEGNAGGRKGAYSHDLFTEEALNFIRANQHAPFFLYLAYTVPHANNELYDATGNGMEVPSDEPYSGEPWPQVEKSFAAMVTRMDRDVGRLLQLLQELGLDDNTAVFFTSDNGPHEEGGHRADFFDSAGPLRGFKRELYEGGIRVPALVRWPGQIPPGTVSDQVWALWDFLATAAEIAGVDVPAPTDGLSVLPTLLGQPQPGHEYLYWAFRERGRVMEAVRMGDWKGVRHDRDEVELYYLLADAGETHDVAGMRPEIVDAMGRIMETYGGVTA